MVSGKTKTLQKRYQGFLSTPCLWFGDAVYNLMQFEITSSPKKITISIGDKLRLGKYVERLVSYQLQQNENITVLAENVQVQENKTTLGELDCLLLKDGKPIHLEVIYKFYLYDSSVGTTEIEHFVGPNRKDSLRQKLTKLKEKQLPLLYSETCKPYLKSLNLKSEDIIQRVYFKAQLFLPYCSQNIQLNTLNLDCIYGFYITQNELDTFENCKFYIPSKKDWLIAPHPNVDWIKFKELRDITNELLEQKYSCLFWLKHKSGVIEKVFWVWW
nr:DUF1853 family protein [Hyunsoonleella aquatilis]